MKYNIKPVPAPRMTRRDIWLKPPRPAVARYRAFKDELQLLNLKLTEFHHVHFIIPMPKSWSKKKKLEKMNEPHKQTPDIDNLIKALYDGLYRDDSHISDVRASKWWGEASCIIVEEIKPPKFPTEDLS